ncbi:hypothetical protein FJZ36_12325 [Candidatus Poribacteria bacterium]|nr:hypothetical protein [Candidatus Poribacteria bacterium]
MSPRLHRAIAMCPCVLALVLMVVTAHAADDDRAPYATRRLPGQQLSTPPTIDGDISDAVWSEAALGDTFIDRNDGKPVQDQTRLWIGYDATNIYVAAHCYDPDPSKLVARETQRDARLWGDDNFQFQIDPFHTHDWNDLSRFLVNPIGTMSSEIGGGRSGKAEWKGDWKAAAKIVEDGWTLEMAIPWAILTYPNSSEPVTIGFNASRNHSRRKFESWFSDIGRNHRNEYSANLEGVVLPASAFTRELLVLPFLAAGSAEVDNDWSGTARLGADVRFRPSPTITAVVALNPDFRNVQGEVEGIDFSRGERWVQESRPFFQEGDDMLRLGSPAGSYFYSRRVENIDVGAKVYGKLAKRTNVGVLGTFDLDDQHDDLRHLYRQDYAGSVTQGIGEHARLSVSSAVKRSPLHDNTVVGYRANSRLTRNSGMDIQYGSSSLMGVDPNDESSEVRQFLRGDLASIGGNWWNGKRFVGGDVQYVSPGFRAANGFIEDPGRRGVGFEGGYQNEWRDSFISNVGGFFGGMYQERYTTGEGFDGLGGVARRAVTTFSDRDGETQFFRDRVGGDMFIGTRRNMRFNIDFGMGRYREEGASASDFDWSWGYGTGAGNEKRTRGFNARHSFGEAARTFRHFVSTGGFVKRGKISTSLNLSILRHEERRQQHIWGVSYELSSSMSVSGRIVLRRDERSNHNDWNSFVSFRRSGEAGIETYIILGDPSADTFVPRVEGKVLLPM